MTAGWYLVFEGSGRTGNANQRRTYGTAKSNVTPQAAPPCWRAALEIQSDPDDGGALLRRHQHSGAGRIVLHAPGLRPGFAIAIGRNADWPFGADVRPLCHQRHTRIYPRPHHEPGWYAHRQNTFAAGFLSRTNSAA